MPELDHDRLKSDELYEARALRLALPVVIERMMLVADNDEPPARRDDEDPERWDGMG